MSDKFLKMVGLEPIRTSERLEDGNWKVTVIPPLNTEGASVVLTAEQYFRYERWLRGGNYLIQELLPELSADDREILLSGIGPEQWDNMWENEE